jgi:hypothetical protein
MLRSLVTLKPRDGWTLVESGKPDRPYPIAEARNRLAQATLDVGAEWLLNMDQDAVLHPNTLLRLQSWGKPIVGALAFSRYPPPVPTIYGGHDAEEKDPDWRWCQVGETREWLLEHEELLGTNDPVVLDPRPPNALRPVGFTGCHCLLVHRQVLVDIKAKFDLWFERLTGPKVQGTGIDRDFCNKARAVGYDIYVDRSVVAGHLATRSIGVMDFLAYDQVADWDSIESPDARA